MNSTEEPHKTYKGAFNVRLSAELHQKAALLAARKDISLNDFVRKAIILALEQENINQKLELNRSQIVTGSKG